MGISISPTRQAELGQGLGADVVLTQIGVGLQDLSNHLPGDQTDDDGDPGSPDTGFAAPSPRWSE